METTEHIVESFIRHNKGWFTISNIKAKGGKEIDILAIEIDKNKIKNRYHIEIGITHKKGFALKGESNKKDYNNDGKWRHKNNIDFFHKEKFKCAAGNSAWSERLAKTRS